MKQPLFFFRKLHFTLMELLIVFCILAAGIAITGVKIHDFYKEQQFLTDSERLLGQLSFAQDLMLIMDTDALFSLSYDPTTKNLVSKITLEKPLEANLKKIIESPQTYGSIKKIEFGKGPNKKTALPLLLEFTLSAMPKGNLSFFDSLHPRNGKEENKIIKLLGYPSPLTLSSEEEEKKRQSRTKNEPPFPKEVYEELYSPHETSKTP